MRAGTVRLLGLAGALALLTGVAGAQDSKPVSFGVMGGLSMPMGNLGDFYDSGYNITGNVYFTPSASRFMIRGDVGYDSFGGQSIAGVGSADLSVLSASGNVIFPLRSNMAEGSIRPYLIAGGGAYRSSFKGDILGASDSESNTDLGIAVGGGLEFKLAGFSTFAEARFTNLFNDGDSARWIPITFGIRF